LEGVSGTLQPNLKSPRVASVQRASTSRTPRAVIE
jgi:hypothetical protein